MDIESDDSERWEDFFGSSTDLTPSLIGLYDSLNGSLNTSDGIAEEDEKEATTPTAEGLAGGNVDLGSCPLTINASHHSVANKHRGFQVLSPNVQRLISHSGVVVEKIDRGLLQCNNFTGSNTCINTSSSKAAKPKTGKQKFSHLPLSRNTCKLTQSGNELVETFDIRIQSSNESLDRITLSSSKNTNNSADSIGGDKTPTNSFNDSFNYDERNLENVINHSDITCANLIKNASQLTKKYVIAQSRTQKSINQATTTNQKEVAQKQENNSTVVRVSDIVKRFHVGEPVTNPPTKSTMQNSSDLTSTSVEDEKKCHEDAEINCALNGVSQISISDTKKSDKISEKTCARKLTPPSTPLLTYARVKSLAAKNSIANSQKLQRKLSAESLDELTDIKKKCSLVLSLSPKGNRKLGLILPDIARLKHRPLSSSSICSTSSSSSSGSEHHIGKLGTSYLASVESLADQSENEIVDSASTLTVFERTCLEIIDSERSYVEDLRQVITGYLQDWKERACLKLDELKILFSNIQEIYEFNSILLKQLINSGMDPVKIAKCFVDLKDRFDVYTSYCTSYPEAISLLTSLLQASHTNALLTSTQKMLQHTLPLGSYLLKPVQRILKYHLLLDNLCKHCDIEEVVQAHELMRKVARNIDQVKKKLEQQSRVKELSGILDGWLGPELTVLGELRQEGLLMENNKPRMVFLFQTMLIITKQKEDNRLQFKSYIYRNNLMLREHLPGEPTSFNVIPYDEPRNQIKLTAKNRDQKRLWAQHIKGVILEQFDIPSRAKELVFKLGDEEDRTPDKNIWNIWSHNSSTPMYLERRNQYRRSEMRNRSKLKRKTITNSTSFDTFNERNNLEKCNLTRNRSMDDNMIPSLPKFSKEVTTSSQKDKLIKCDHAGNSCNCSLTENESKDECSRNSLKERSKSVPRIPNCHTAESDDDIQINSNKKLTDPGKCSTLKKSKSAKGGDVKMYNTKTIPKRIANLKKSRAKKETSKFYMDLDEMDTVLKITESTDNLTASVNSDSIVIKKNCNEEKEDIRSNLDEPEVNVEDTPKIVEETKRDVEIISELLKEHKELGRIMKKPPKKRSFDNGRIPSSPEPVQIEFVVDTPPPPPSNSPPPLDSEDRKEKLLVQGQGVVTNGEKSEHVYETLLRNVHVPYKFSPVLNRSKSQQYYTNTSKEIKVKTLQRPESDYVTLAYTDSGDLKTIGGDLVRKISAADTLRNSDSNINYENLEKSEKKLSNSKTTPSASFSSISDLQRQEETISAAQKKILQRFIAPKNEQVTGSENSLLPRVRKSVDSVSLSFLKTNKPPERRVSDVTEMCRQSIIHKQGSEAVGERMANLDYVDPRTLFSCSVNNSAISLNPQRDSVFSLTSSSDSVCDSKKKLETVETINPQFIYEDSVEACLENDFRDSAVYSDDSERRQGHNDEHDAPLKRPSSPPPPPPPRPNNLQAVAKQIPILNIPPPIPAKPNIPLKKLSSINSNEDRATGAISPSESETSAKSWVLQQIQNFNK